MNNIFLFIDQWYMCILLISEIFQGQWFSHHSALILRCLFFYLLYNAIIGKNEKLNN